MRRETLLGAGPSPPPPSLLLELALWQFSEAGSGLCEACWGARVAWIVWIVWTRADRRCVATLKLCNPAADPWDCRRRAHVLQAAPAGAETPVDICMTGSFLAKRARPYAMGDAFNMLSGEETVMCYA